MGYLVGLLISLAILSIPISAIFLSSRKKTQENKIKEMELQKEILKLEIEKQSGTVKLLEEENKKLDKMIKNINE